MPEEFDGFDWTPPTQGISSAISSRLRRWKKLPSFRM